MTTLRRLLAACLILGSVVSHGAVAAGAGSPSRLTPAATLGAASALAAPATLPTPTPSPAPQQTAPAADATKKVVPPEKVVRAESAPASRVDKIVQLVKAIQELISGILTSIGWALVTLIVLVVFRARVENVLQTLAEVMQDRAVSVDVGTVVKLQVAEPPADGLDDRRALFSPSPFEIDDDIVRDGSTPLREIVPQLTFQVSDSIGRTHEHAGGGHAAKRMREARAQLIAVCDDAARTDPAIRTALVRFVVTLEASRFLEAHRFADLLTRHRFLQDAVDALAPSDVARDHVDFAVLNAAGVAYAQTGKWKAALNALDRIALKGAVPLYAPAGATWLACKYHNYIETLEKTKPGSELDSSDFYKEVNAMAVQGGLIVTAIRAQDWAPLSLGAPKGYYLREALKDRGNVLGIAAEYPADRVERRLFYESAEKDLVACSLPIEGEDASSMDHNNLADLYRQLAEFVKPDARDQADRYYWLAHEQIDRALQVGPRRDPAFYHTRALVFFSERQPLKAFHALEEYGASDAAASGDPQDVEQYVENQIFAAKLLFALRPRNEAPDLARIACTLEDARAFLERQRALVGDESADDLQGGIELLLGFAFLRWPGHEPEAVAAFDRLFRLRQWIGSDAIRFRCRLGRAKARTRSARIERRQFSRGTAALLRKQAAEDLAAVATSIDAFGYGATVPDGRRQRNLRLCLDAGIAFQALAEERFAADESVGTEELAEKETGVLRSLRAAVLDGVVVGDDERQIREQVEQCEKRRSFLAALTAIRNDPSFKDDALVQKVTTNLNLARGINADFNCRIDLALGQLLLAAARLGKPDAARLYGDAVAALERAAERDAPALRAEAIQALASAYAARGHFLRKPKASAAAK